MKTQKIIVKSPANIAFIKYWGQRDIHNILPYNDSFSMNLSHCYTIIALEILNDLKIQQLYIKDYRSSSFKKANNETLQKVNEFYSRAKAYVGQSHDFGFRIHSENSFPKRAGIASSASFFAGLSIAFLEGFGKSLSEKKRSILARLSGSGSACRSIPDGFCWWNSGVNSDTSYARSIAPPEFWDLRDIVLILSSKEKSITSQQGHKGASTSPFFKSRIEELKKRSDSIKNIFFERDFDRFGTLIEDEAISMHMVMMTQSPALYYWSGKTVDIMKKIQTLRKSGLSHYFTIDAGENVHVICEGKNESKIVSFYKKQAEVEDIIVNCPSVGARVVS